MAETLHPHIQVTWLGHATFLLRTASGQTVVVDPWLAGNPACPEPFRHLDTADAILITHGHFDHIGDAIGLARRARPAHVVAPFETCEWLKSKGVENTLGMNKGGTVEILDTHVTMVGADHSCGITDGDQIIYGGAAAGYVIDFADGFSLYHAGDTNVFGDMQLIGELYEPDVALLPIGGHYTMGPREAAVACRLLGVSRVVPMHHGTFPVLSGTAAELQAELQNQSPRCQVVELQPGTPG